MNTEFSFREGRLTGTALLFFKESMLQNMQENMFTLALFVDFSKAFDCLDHATLLDKLQHYGIRGIPLNLFQSYLNKRLQPQMYKWPSITPPTQEIRCSTMECACTPFVYLYINNITQVRPNSLNMMTTALLLWPDKPIIIPI